MNWAPLTLQDILYAAAPLIALSNPIAEIGVFLTIVEGQTAQQRAAAALKVGIGVLLVLGASAIIGGYVLNWVGVSIPAFRAAGGLLLVVMGLQMAHGEEPALQHVANVDETDDRLWVPLIMPMLAGPGTIVTAISLALREEAIRGLPVATLLGVLASSLVVVAVLLPAAHVSGYIGVRARRILTRFSGLLLVGIGCQMGFTGIAEFFRPLLA